MPAPTNTTPATAIAMTPLPYSTTQDVNFGGTTYTVYYSYTPSADGELYASFFGGAAFVYLALADVVNASGTPIDFGNGTTVTAQDVPMQIPVTAGTTYYFKVSSSAGNVGTAILAVDVRLFSATAAPVGSLLIPDDTNGLSACVASSVTDYMVHRFVPGLATGELGDVLNDGTILLSNITAADITQSTLKLYSNQLSLLATPVSNTGIRGITSNRTSTFYVARDANSDSVQKVSSAGILGAVVASGMAWGMPEFVGIAVSPDENTLYYAPSQTSGGGTLAGAVKRWNLSTNTTMSDLAAGIATYYTGGREILCLSDGKIVVPYWKNSTTAQVVIYTSAGATFATYVIATVSGSIGSTLRLAHSTDNQTSFWLWVENSAQTICRFRNIRVSDGTVLAERIHAYYERAVYQDNFTGTPTAYFGVSESCPLVVLRVPLGAPSTTTTYPVRRLRQSPHLSTEQVWQFFSNFQVDLESGVGLTTGQGSDPQVMLSWSDDGGHTWSAERWVSAGAIGQYTKRARWIGSLGRSRDRVWRIVVSDPVAWRILQAFVGVEKGTS